MKLQDILRRECVGVNIKTADKPAMLREIAHLAKNCTLLNAVSESEVLRGFETREEIGSTGFGEGVAIPHCRLEGVDEFVVGVITSPDGMDFDSLDGEKTRLFVFIVAPLLESNEHIHVLSAISQTLRVPGAVDEIVAEVSDTGVYESFLRYGIEESVANGKKVKSLIHVFVGKEDIFHEILQLLSAMNCPAVVTGAEPSSKYLIHVPIYAGLWSDREKMFNRIIITVMDKRLINEGVRRIEQVTGPLKDSNGVLVVVQDISYVGGDLES